MLLPAPLGGGTETVPLWEGQNGRGTNQPVEGGGGPPQPPNGGGGKLAQHSWKGVEECLSDWWVGEELLHLVVMEVVMRMVMTMEGVIDHLPQGEMEEEMAVMVVMVEMMVEEMILHHHQIKGNHNAANIREIDGYMWCKDHPDPPGQPGQDGKNGRDGQIPQLSRGVIDVPGVAPTPLDTTGLENSFENLGRTMVDVLTIQKQTNLALQDQIRRANDTQIEQTLAMHDLVDMTEQRTYDSMFAAVPIYHGNDDEDFDEWADQLEAFCEISRQNIHHEMMGRLSAAVKKIIRSIDPNLRWSLACQELKRCVSDEKSMAYSAFKLNTLVQNPNKNVQMYIIKYANLHQTVTGKRPEQETDQLHLTKFLISINNVEISREICR